MAVPIERLALMRDGEAFFAHCAARLEPDTATEESRLPGWSRSHVVAHVALNAIALGNLMEWARTGVVTPMYGSTDQRTRDINRHALLPIETLRAKLSEASSRLVRLAEDLPSSAWDVEVRTALGREVPASEVPWMRARETWIHAIDLDLGPSFSDLPTGFLDAIVEEAVVRLQGLDSGSELTIFDTTTQRRWSVGRPSDVEVRGSSAVLAGWLLRGDSSSLVDAPPAPRWL